MLRTTDRRREELLLLELVRKPNSLRLKKLKNLLMRKVGLTKVVISPINSKLQRKKAQTKLITKQTRRKKKCLGLQNISQLLIRIRIKVEPLKAWGIMHSQLNSEEA